MCNASNSQSSCKIRTWSYEYITIKKLLVIPTYSGKS